MNNEKTIPALASLGMSEGQAKALTNHLEKAEAFVQSVDPGIEKAFDWLYLSLYSALPEEDATLLFQIASKAIVDPKVEYLEKGYDSCQSQRKLAKIVGDAVLCGGLLFEAELLGLSKEPLISGLATEELDQLKIIAKNYGGAQDFLFPGVTPSSGETPSLSEMAYLTLQGKPATSVRTVTGVGGLRFDKDWNFAGDLVTFANLKVTEDKRYYPGIGIFYFLASREFESIPVIAQLKFSQSKLFLAIAEFVAALKKTTKYEYGGVSVLCSAYLPPWSELKKTQAFVTQKNLELAQAFHSPSYEFVVLKNVFEKVGQSGIVDEGLIGALKDLTKKLDHCWSFNSTIHLPWTAELAGLSNDFIGKITNLQGDCCIRYGVGYKGKSLEIREYFFGNERKFPQGLAGQKAYGLRWYPATETFEGTCYEMPVDFSDKFIQKIIKKGFLAAALELLESRHEM